MRTYNIRTDAMQTTLRAESAQKALRQIIADEYITDAKINDGAYAVATAEDGTDSASVGQPR